MLRMIAQRYWGIEVDDGTDEVMFGINLPVGSIVHSVNAELHFMCGSISGGSNQFPLNTATMIAVEGYVIPVHDPDTLIGMNVLWDRYVPKDTDTDVIDLDTAASDGTSFFEPGEVALANLYDIGVRPKKVFGQKRLLTPMNASIHTHQAIATPADPGKWTPGGSMRISLRKPFRVRQPSILAYAFGSPLLDDTATTSPAMLAEAQWPQLKYMEDTLKRALLHQMGVFEAGAETPWEEASALLRFHLNPDVLEDVTGQFILSGEWSVYGMATINHSVTGTLELGTVRAGR